MSLSAGQIWALQITEKVGSCFSLVGALFIITTFLFDKGFRKPIHRIFFYASWGNILANVATLISMSGITRGPDGPLCQVQAFLIQWFMVADGYWALSMACNVYLTFFRKYDAGQLRAMDWKYVVLCYGISFIPSFVYLFIQSSSRGKIYGSAVLWCWISTDWDYLRIATGYGPVWVSLLATFGIYLRTGKVVFEWRRQLLLATQHTANISTTASDESAPSPAILKSTDVYVTTKAIQPWEPGQRTRFSTDTEGRGNPGPLAAATNNLEAGPEPLKSPTMSSTSMTRSNIDEKPINRTSQSHLNPSQNRATINANKAAIHYCKCAVLFFIALLVTWVPSSINRFYMLAHPDTPSWGLAYTAGLVLPLQGFWNGVIYATTSYQLTKAFFRRLFGLERSR